MKVRYIKDTKKGGCTKGKIYEVLEIELDWYRIIDDTDEAYIYPPEEFEIVENEPIPPTVEPITEAEMEQLYS